jgi:hypothetical protein
MSKIPTLLKRRRVEESVWKVKVEVRTRDTRAEKKREILGLREGSWVRETRPEGEMGPGPDGSEGKE